MSHLDPDQLTLLALGEPVATDADSEHLATCEACARELADLRRTALLARTTVGDGGLESPPDRVWTRLTEELGLSGTVPEPPSGAIDAPTTDAQGDADADADADAVEEPHAATGTSRGRRRSRVIWALAASLVLIAGIGAGIWAVAAALAPTAIAAAALEPFPDHPDASGSADVEVARDGSRTLTVTLDGDQAEDGYREVWLIRNDAAALISLGVLEGAEGSFAIPAGVDLQEYSIVDISVEPVDGDPAHSGDSIVRGELS